MAEFDPLILVCGASAGLITIGGFALSRLRRRPVVSTFEQVSLIFQPNEPSLFPQFLQLVKDHHYPLVNTGDCQAVDRWEENLLLSRRSNDRHLNHLIDQHLKSIIFATRIGVLDPHDFFNREVRYRTEGSETLPPVTRCFEWSMMYIYDQLINEAESNKELDKSQVLSRLKEQFGQVLKATGLRYEGETGVMLRDMLSTFGSYYKEDN